MERQEDLALQLSGFLTAVCNTLGYVQCACIDTPLHRMPMFIQPNLGYTNNSISLVYFHYYRAQDSVTQWWPLGKHVEPGAPGWGRHTHRAGSLERLAAHYSYCVFSCNTTGIRQCYNSRDNGGPFGVLVNNEFLTSSKNPRLQSWLSVHKPSQRWETTHRRPRIVFVRHPHLWKPCVAALSATAVLRDRPYPQQLPLLPFPLLPALQAWPCAFQPLGRPGMTGV